MPVGSTPRIWGSSTSQPPPRPTTGNAHPDYVRRNARLASSNSSIMSATKVRLSRPDRTETPNKPRCGSLERRIDVGAMARKRMGISGGPGRSSPQGSRHRDRSRKDRFPCLVRNGRGARSGSLRLLRPRGEKAVGPKGLDECADRARGSHRPGEYWFYNNWDFNVLATILRQAIGKDAFSAFESWFARPMKMQDFDPGRCTDFAEAGTIHPAYLFCMSARDLARLGLLYLRGGTWMNDQLLPEAWIADSLSPHSKSAHGYEAHTIAFGLMWWVFRPELLGGFRCHAALGGSGHGVFVLPEIDAVIVHRNLNEAAAPSWPDILPMLAETAALCRSLAPE